MIQPDQRSSHLHSPRQDKNTSFVTWERCLRKHTLCYKTTKQNPHINVKLHTTEDPLLVREDANVLSKRLSEGYGHLICFPVLMRQDRLTQNKERNSRSQRIKRILDQPSE